MDTVLIVARVALAGIFVVAGLAKLADMPGSRRALEGFGVEGRLVAWVAVALPLAELMAAVLLLPEATARVGAAIGAVLLTAFVAGIANALRRGRRPDCHCFGQIHSRPAGRETIVRNLVLLAVAALVLVGGAGDSFGDWLSDSSVDHIALAATSLSLLVMTYAYVMLWLERRGPLGAPGGELPAIVQPGEGLPDFTLPDSTGRRLSSGDLRGERSILVFVSATCGPCLNLLPELARWRRMLEGRLAVHVLASGEEEENRRLSDEHNLPMLFDRDGSVTLSFGIMGTPSGIEVDTSGVVVSPPAGGAPAIEGLIRAALKRPTGPTRLDVRQVEPQSSS